MKAILVLLALIGAACALQKDMLYEYEYSGRVATGIPKIRARVAGTKVRASVLVQMKSASQAIVKIEKIKFGDGIKTLDVDARGEFDPEMRDPEGDAINLEKPFGVNFLSQGDGCMEVPSNDVEWITNVRKGIANTLKNAAIRANMGATDEAARAVKSDNQDSIAFQAYEPSMQGRCLTQYTMIKLPKSMAEEQEAKLKQVMKEDIQMSGKKSSQAPKLSRDLWKMTKAIDFDHCYDNVQLQHAPVGNTTKLGRSQFEYAQSRSSVGEYILRGSQGNFRVETAIVEGSVITSPFGYDTEKIMTVTNQTIILRGVNPGSSVKLSLGSDTKKVRSWFYEVMSPFSAPSGDLSYLERVWINYKNQGQKVTPYLMESILTGKPSTDSQHQQEFAQAARRLLEEATNQLMALTRGPNSAKSYLGTTAGTATVQLEIITRLAQGLQKQQLQQIVNEVFQQSTSARGQVKKMILIDALAASGSGAAVEILVEKIRQSQITPARAASVFMTLPNNLIAPATVKDLIELAKQFSLNSHPYLGSAALINVARIAHHQCLSKRYQNITIPAPVLGSTANCKPQDVSGFLQYLESQLKGAQQSWQRIIYIRAIANLGSQVQGQDIVAVLKPAILGQYDRNVFVRSSAVSALVRPKISQSKRQEVFDLLMSVIADYSADTKLRQTCVGTLLTWKPNAGFYTRMAAMSWKEPSRQMQAFITSSLRSVAQSSDPRDLKQARIAEQALLRAKPVYPTARYSYNMKWTRFNEFSKVGASVNMAWLNDARAAFPKEVYMMLQGSFGGYRVTPFEANLAGEGLQEMYNKVKNAFMKNVQTINPRAPESERMAHKLHDKYMEEIAPMQIEGSEMEGFLYLNFFENMKQVFPLNGEALEKAFSDSKIMSQLTSGQGKEVHLTKFINPMPLTSFVANELGLPIITTVMTPTVQVAEGTGHLNIPGAQSPPSAADIISAKKIEFNGKLNYKLVMKMNTMVKVLAPWTEKTIAAVVDTEKTITLPAQINFQMDRSQSSGEKHIRLSAEVTESSKFPVMYAHNLPIVMIKKMMPGQDANQIQNIEVITMNAQKSPLVSRSYSAASKFTGLSTELRWDADAEFGVTPGYIYDMIRKPEKLFRAALSPMSRMWRAQLFLDPQQSRSKKVELYAGYVSSASVSASPVQQPFEAADSPAQRAAKVKALAAKPEYQGELRSARVRIGFGSSPSAYHYELCGSYHPITTQAQYEKMLFNIDFRRSAVPSYDSAEYALCARNEIEMPQLETIENLKQLLQSQVDMKLNTKVFSGKSCNSQVIARFQGKLDLSQARKESLQQEVQRSCIADCPDPTLTYPVDAVYDMADLKITWEQSMPDTVLNMTYIADDVMRGWCWPHVFDNYMNVQNQERTVVLEARRPVRRWDIFVRKPKSNTRIPGLYLPRFVDQIVPLGGLKTPLRQFPSVFFPSETSSEGGICIVQPAQIHTFHSHTLDFDTSKVSPACWMTIARLATGQTSKSWKIEARYPSGSQSPRVRIVAPAESLAIELTETSVYKNGQPVPINRAQTPIVGPQGHRWAEVQKLSNGSLSLQITGKAAIKIRQSQVFLAINAAHAGQIAGTCGSLSGSRSVIDEVGPQRCIYHDATLFRAAWSSQAPGCSNQLVQAVHKYQQSCHKAPASTFNPAMSTNFMKSSCMQKSHAVFKKSGEVCVTADRVPACQSHCRAESRKQLETQAYCFAPSSAPSEIKAQLPAGHIAQVPASVRSQPRRTVVVPVPTSCGKQ